MKVKDVMTKNPITISPNQTVEDADNCIKKMHIWTLPVVEDTKVIGVVTKFDINRRSKNRRQKIREIMSTPGYSVSANEDLDLAFKKIKRARINALSVIENDRLVGIITWSDIKNAGLKIKKHCCNYCGCMYNISDDKCPNCGAPMK